jgi:hypothetical protein
MSVSLASLSCLRQGAQPPVRPQIPSCWRLHSHRRRRHGVRAAVGAELLMAESASYDAKSAERYPDIALRPIQPQPVVLDENGLVPNQASLAAVPAALEPLLGAALAAYQAEVRCLGRGLVALAVRTTTSTASIVQLAGAFVLWCKLKGSIAHALSFSPSHAGAPRRTHRCLPSRQPGAAGLLSARGVRCRLPGLVSRAGKRANQHGWRGGGGARRRHCCGSGGTQQTYSLGVAAAASSRAPAARLSASH